MLKFRSLTAKFVFISVLFIAFIIALVISGFVFTHHITGESMRINHAGRLRFHHFEITLLAHRALETKQPALRKALVSESREYMESVDRIVSDLRNGNKALYIKSSRHYLELLPQFNNLVDEWNNDLKPIIQRILQYPDAKSKGLLDAYTLKIDNYVHRIDSYAKALTDRHEREIKEFDRFRIYALIFFVFASVFVIIFMRRTILAPVQRLKDVSLEIRKGNFNVRTDVDNSDELGELAQSFNQMSQAIGMLVDEKTTHLKELDVLNRISNAASRTLSLEDLLEMVMDEMLRLEPLKLEKKGAIFLYDEKANVLHLSVSRSFGAEQKTGCSLVHEGECLCGLVAEQKEMLLSESNTGDKRHSKVYPDAKEHGHIILPLKSRGKMLGVLCLYLAAEVRLSEKEIELYKSIGDIIAVAMQNAINHRQVAMLAQSLDSSNDVIVITDTGGRIIHVNPQTLIQLVYSGDELLGQPVSVMQSPDNPPGLGEEIFRKTMEGGWVGEITNRRKDGTEYPVLLTTSPVKDAAGTIIALVGIARDITEHKRTEELLKKYNEELEAQVKERTSELEHARFQADAANRAKSEFLANMSHELRTPLNSIIGFSDIMLDGIAGEVSDLQKENIGYINISGKHLLSLINDILDLSKVEAGKLELELSIFPLRDILNASLIMLREKAMKHGIGLDLKIGPEADMEIEADERKLKQILFNLMSNAVKFTPDGGSVRVTARRVRSLESGVESKDHITPELITQHSELDGNFVEISVADTGTGIRPEDMDRLFRPFSQIESAYTKEFEGTGLGLALTKKLVELHGGRIWVESEYGKGSRFVLAIPLRQGRMII